MFFGRKFLMDNINAREIKQVKETLQVPCIHSKSGTGMTATVNDVPILLFAIKTAKGDIVYHYAPACKNYKLSESGSYICETALGGTETCCQLEEVLNDALEREGILYAPARQTAKTEPPQTTNTP